MRPPGSKQHLEKRKLVAKITKNVLKTKLCLSILQDNSKHLWDKRCRETRKVIQQRRLLLKKQQHRNKDFDPTPSDIEDFKKNYSEDDSIVSQMYDDATVSVIDEEDDL